MQNRFLFKVLVLAQFAIFAMFLSVSVYLFAMSRSPNAIEESVPGLEKSAIICAVLCPLWLIPTLGIQSHAKWGWWSGLVINFIVFVVSAWGLSYKEAQIDWYAMIGPGIFLVLVILHLIARPETWQIKKQAAVPAFLKR